MRHRERTSAIASNLGHRSWRRRRRAIRRLTAIEGWAASDLLLKGCDDPDPRVRVAAAKALGRVHAQGSAREVLVGLLDDPEFDVRFQAALVLAPTRDARALSVLVSALGAPDPRLQRDTALAIASLTDQERDWIEFVLATLTSPRTC
jgi:HEAT repeat protein